MRGKSANDDPQEEADDPLNSSLSSVTTSNAAVSASSSSSSSSSSSYAFIKAKEDWENWYPMEWIAWTTFGVPSDEPTVHWVNEAIEDGPEVTEGRKKPLGRVDQRRKENELKATTKATTEISALRITETTLHQREVTMAERDNDLNRISFFMTFSKTSAAIVSTFFVTFFLVFSSIIYRNNI